MAKRNYYGLGIGDKRIDIKQVKTPYGNLVVGESSVTLVAGFYKKDIPQEQLMPGTAGVIVETVPPEKELEIAGLLTEKGYKTPIHFW